MGMPTAKTILLVLVIVFQGRAEQPVKLALQADRRSVGLGSENELTVQLLDAQNQPAAASKTMHIALSARSPAGKVEDLGTVDFGVGEAAKRVSRKLPDLGLLYVWAKNPELLQGGQFVNVKRSAGLPAPVTKPAPLQELKNFDRQVRPAITLRYSPQRAFLADGRDAATVEAFLIGDIESYAQDIRLNVYDSSHALTPTPLVIPAGQALGHAALTSSTAGAVSVEYLGSAPPASFQGDTKLNINFLPPITQVRLEVSPPSFSLVDVADVLITLTDDQGRTLSPAAKRTISLALKGGHGHLTDQELTIAPGQIQARTTFIPNAPGQMMMEAHTDNLASVTTQFRVSVPFVLLIASVIGGATGGLLARRTRRKIDKYRVPIGIVTGLIFYWACIFLGIATIARAVVLNPISAGVLSAIGGWLQTKVFDLVWGAARAPQKTASR
jgi:hypothetical protein